MTRALGGIAVLPVLLLSALAPAVAHADSFRGCGWEWRAQLENDASDLIANLAHGTDDNYTGGWQLSAAQCWIPLHLEHPPWYFHLWKLTLHDPQRLAERRLETSWAVGMKFYSPDRIGVDTKQLDRPFAGITSTRWSASFGYDTYISAISVALDLGVVGSWSGAEEFQSFIHSFVSLDSLRPLGWKQQIGHGIELNLDVTWTQQLFAWGRSPTGEYRTTDLVFDADLVGGTTWDRAGVGLTFRHGKNVPSAAEGGPIAQTAPSPAPAGPSAAPPPPAPKPPTSYYALLSAHARGVLYNGYLQGAWGLHWGYASPVTREPYPVTVELGVGGGVITFPWRLTYGIFFRTREMRDIDIERTWERFALIAVAYLVP
jgi:hypothetical protein